MTVALFDYQLSQPENQLDDLKINFRNCLVRSRNYPARLAARPDVL